MNSKINSNKLVIFNVYNVINMFKKKMHVTKISFFINVFYKRDFKNCRFIFIYKIEKFDVIKILS